MVVEGYTNDHVEPVNPVMFSDEGGAPLNSSLPDAQAEKIAAHMPWITGEASLDEFVTEKGEHLCAQCACTNCPIYKLKDRGTLMEVTEVAPKPKSLNKTPSAEDKIVPPILLGKTSLVDAVIPKKEEQKLETNDETPENPVIAQQQVVTQEQEAPMPEEVREEAIVAVHPVHTDEAISQVVETTVISQEPAPQFTQKQEYSQKSSSVDTTSVIHSAEEPQETTSVAEAKPKREDEQIVLPVYHSTEEAQYEPIQVKVVSKTEDSGEGPVNKTLPKEPPEVVVPKDPPETPEQITATLVVPAEREESAEPEIETAQVLFDQIVRIAQGMPSEFFPKDEESADEPEPEIKNVIVLRSGEKIVKIERQKLLRILSALPANLQRSVEYKKLVEAITKTEKSEQKEYTEFAQEELLWQNAGQTQQQSTLWAFYLWAFIREYYLKAPVNMSARSAMVITPNIATV